MFLAKQSRVFLHSLFLVSWDGARLTWVHLVLRSLTGLLYQLRMVDDDECGAVGGIWIGRGNRSTRIKPAPVPLCPPQIPHKLTWARTRVATIGSRRLTAWAMIRPYSSITSVSTKITSINTTRKYDIHHRRGPVSECPLESHPAEGGWRLLPLKRRPPLQDTCVSRREQKCWSWILTSLETKNYRAVEDQQEFNRATGRPIFITSVHDDGGAYSLRNIGNDLRRHTPIVRKYFAAHSRRECFKSCHYHHTWVPTFRMKLLLPSSE
jgi:hypothetical protein